MANKRTLKKYIMGITSELFAECVSAKLYRKDVDAADVDALTLSILRTHGNYICRISHPEPGMPTHAYYKDLLESFHADVNDIIDHINNL